MSTFLLFLAGAWVGAIVTTFTLGLCAMAGDRRQDRRNEDAVRVALAEIADAMIQEAETFLASEDGQS